MHLSLGGDQLKEGPELIQSYCCQQLMKVEKVLMASSICIIEWIQQKMTSCWCMKAQYSVQCSYDNYRSIFWTVDLDQMESQRIKMYISTYQLGLAWIILDHFESSWIILEQLGSAWIILDHLGTTWIFLDFQGSTWVIWITLVD